MNIEQHKLRIDQLSPPDCSPPAATAFGGGILDPTPGDEALPFFHAVPLDSDSDSGLEVDERTAAGTDGVAGRPSEPQGP